MMVNKFFAAGGLGLGLFFASLHYTGVIGSNENTRTMVSQQQETDVQERTVGETRGGVVEMPANLTSGLSGYQELSSYNSQLTGLIRHGDQAITRAIQQLKSAESAEARLNAKQDLRAALSVDYKARLDAYDEYLSDLESRLKDMREKLARRRAAEDDMIELRLKVLEAESNDLGWPTKMPGSYFGVARPGQNTLESGN